MYLQKLFPSLFKNKNPRMFQCEVCQFSKHARNYYQIQPYKASYPFSMIHSDVWGPSRVKNITGTRWFISFVDDHMVIPYERKIRSRTNLQKFQHYGSNAISNKNINVENL